MCKHNLFGSVGKYKFLKLMSMWFIRFDSMPINFLYRKKLKSINS